MASSEEAAESDTQRLALPTSAVFQLIFVAIFLLMNFCFFSQGILYEYEPAKKNQFRNHPLACYFVAEGHTKAVLSVSPLDTLMATGAKGNIYLFLDRQF